MKRRAHLLVKSCLDEQQEVLSWSLQQMKQIDYQTQPTVVIAMHSQKVQVQDIDIDT